MTESIERAYINSWAVSVFTSRTMWVAVLTIGTGLLAVPDVIAVVPLQWLPMTMMLVGAANFGLRYLTVRPVAFIAPGAIKIVQVEKLNPPPPLVTD